MRILNVGDPYFVSYFREWGHQVLTIGEQARSDLRITTSLDLKGLLEFLEARGFLPELVLWNDTCRPPAVHGLERLPAVSIGFSIDQYCNPWQVPYSAIFDLFPVAQKDWLPHFDVDTLPRPCLWFPLFCKPKWDREQGVERDIPVSFVGTLEPRRACGQGSEEGHGAAFGIGQGKANPRVGGRTDERKGPTVATRKPILHATRAGQGLLHARSGSNLPLSDEIRRGFLEIGAGYERAG